MNSIYYYADGIEPRRRDPFIYTTSGSIVFSYSDFSMPVNFTYSNQQVTYQQPFNQFSFNPTYKSIKGYIGYSNMSYSPYTLNGHTFFGLGIEVKPKDSNFNISAMYGRLQKAVELDTSRTENIPAYKRMGAGFKLSYGSNEDYVNFIGFRAFDDLNSLTVVPDTFGIRPMENVVLSISAGKKIAKNLQISGEYANTLITIDSRAPKTESSTLFLTNRTTTTSYRAIKLGLKYNFGFMKLGTGYERIDPGYRTLGAYYFNNDLENITLKLETSLFNKKVKLSTDIGVQRNNLDNSKISTMERIVGRLNMAYKVSKALNLNFTYSNFTTFTNIRSEFVELNSLTPFENLDTLNFTQIAQTFTLNANYLINPNSKKLKQTVNVFASYQKASDKQGDEIQNSGAEFYNANVSFSNNLVKKGLTVVLAVNTNQSKTLISTSRTLGPTLAVNKTMLKRKLRSSLSISYNNSYLDEKKTGSVINYRLSNSFRLKNKHQFSLGIVMLNKLATESDLSEFSEYTVNFGYGIRF